MNNKGFTIVELVSVIAIVAIISTIGVVSYTSLINESADRVFVEYQDSMYVAASNYLTKNYNKQGVTLTFPLRLTIDDLGIKTINNPRTDNNCKANSYVEIKKDTNCDILAFNYTVCLKCGDDFDNCKDYFNKNCA